MHVATMRVTRAMQMGGVLLQRMNALCSAPMIGETMRTLRDEMQRAQIIEAAVGEQLDEGSAHADDDDAAVERVMREVLQQQPPESAEEARAHAEWERYPIPKADASDFRPTRFGAGSSSSIRQPAATVDRYLDGVAQEMESASRDGGARRQKAAAAEARAQ